MTLVSTIESNAVLSIRLAVEDYRTGDPGRTISALRNITAGILLLYKEKLRRLSPPDSNEVLIKKDMLPSIQDGKLVFVGSGNTVDAHLIKERFVSLGITTDWTRTGRIIKLRNNIEHYCSDQVLSVMREVFGSAFFLINDFCRNELDVVPYELFGDDVWNVFLEEKKFLSSLRTPIEEANKKIQWSHPDMYKVARHFVCADCGSGLLKVNDIQAHYEEMEYQCVTCNRVNLFDELIGPALGEAYFPDIYHTFKDIGEHYLEECSNCCHDSFIPTEGHCVVCGDKPYRVCEGCGSEYGINHYCEVCDFEDGLIASSFQPPNYTA